MSLPTELSLKLTTMAFPVFIAIRNSHAFPGCSIHLHALNVQTWPLERPALYKGCITF